MSNQYAHLDQAIRRELRTSPKPDWIKIKKAYPDTPKSSFHHRVKVNKEAITRAGAAKKARLADPFQTTEIRRDPFLLIADFDLVRELVVINGLIDRLRAAALDRRGEVKNLAAFDRSIGHGLKFLKLVPQVTRESEDTEWSSCCRMIAQTMGRSTAVRFSHFRRNMLLDEEWAAFQIAIGLLKDAELANIGRNASAKDLRYAVSLRLKATKALMRWQIRLDSLSLVDRQVQWIMEQVGAHDGLTPEVWESLRQFALVWIFLVGRRCGEERGEVYSPEVDCIGWLKPRDWRNFPGIKAARTFYWGSTPSLGAPG